MHERTTPQNPPASGVRPSRAPPTHDEIADCAYELWIQHGYPERLDQAIWLDAEALLRSGGCRPSDNYRELRRHG
ncbi:MAG TPA: DUF2934 domain-containing protein [Opitutaceae bacterium]|nr:DUF2934 domain-containing protein [Opitutaceae bacterium]HLP07021.1 DUF2934 domain-containing protein [Opitutaceae bacterium]